MKTAVVIGASGLVGSNLVSKLNDTKLYDKVILLVRQKTTLNHLKLEERIIDFDKLDDLVIEGEDVFCAIGTTLKKAGSKENQYTIDCTYPYKIAQIAKQCGAKQYLLVSSVGANPDSASFYLRTKGELEKKIATLDFNAFIILRPSFIMGTRQDFRAGEKIAKFFAYVLGPFLIGKYKKYKGVKAISIAKKMVKLANANLTGKYIIESDQIGEI